MRPAKQQALLQCTPDYSAQTDPPAMPWTRPEKDLRVTEGGVGWAAGVPPAYRGLVLTTLPADAPLHGDDRSSSNNRVSTTNAILSVILTEQAG